MKILIKKTYNYLNYDYDYYYDYLFIEELLKIYFDMNKSLLSLFKI